MTTYFKNVDTLEALRRQYRDLLKVNHPDNGGDVAKMQEINAEYDRLFKLLKDKHERKTAGNTENGSKADFNIMKYDFSEDQKLREVLQKIISFSGITIDVVGCFIWVDGSTYQYKEDLKAIGFRWSGQRKKWYWSNGEYRKRGNSKLSYADIQNKYGSTEVETEQRELLKQA